MRGDVFLSVETSTAFPNNTTLNIKHLSVLKSGGGIPPTTFPMKCCWWYPTPN
jgi:hypothetical protein